jgi:hypothetical protein
MKHCDVLIVYLLIGLCDTSPHLQGRKYMIVEPLILYIVGTLCQHSADGIGKPIHESQESWLGVRLAVSCFRPELTMAILVRCSCADTKQTSLARNFPCTPIVRPKSHPRSSERDHCIAQDIRRLGDTLNLTCYQEISASLLCACRHANPIRIHPVAVP